MRIITIIGSLLLAGCASAPTETTWDGTTHAVEKYCATPSEKRIAMDTAAKLAISAAAKIPVSTVPYIDPCGIAP